MVKVTTQSPIRTPRSSTLGHTDLVNGLRDLPNVPSGENIGARGYTQVACSRACEGFALFSLQSGPEIDGSPNPNGPQCFCGNDEPNNPQVDDAECGGVFGVGGLNRNAVYRVAVPNFQYRGCHTDFTNARDLPFGPSAITTADRGYNQISCSVACEGFNFFGLEDSTGTVNNVTGSECYCGNDPPANEQRPDSECGGESGLGLANRSAIYVINKRPTNYIGCHVDNAGTGRDLKFGPSIQSEQNRGWTPTTCAVACDAFTYFALQNGNILLDGRIIENPAGAQSSAATRRPRARSGRTLSAPVTLAAPSETPSSSLQLLQP